MTTEKDMVDLLDRRYARPAKNGFPVNIVASQATLNFSRYIDYFVAEAYSFEEKTEDGKCVRRPPALHGFEIKISRSDWLREHKTDGAKSLAWRSRLNFWWLVVPDKKIIKPEELPDEWGLLVGTTRLRAVKKPIWQEPERPLTTRECFTIARYAQWHNQRIEEQNDHHPLQQNPL